jgi:radical SAM family uncharacterized protein/radical SAM-linked protein
LVGRLPESLIYRLMSAVRRPGRYFSSHINFPVKRDARFRFLLCFPDLYEIGMSNLGLRILYHVLNRHPDTMADLAFAPWMDMEAFMRDNREPLFGIGTLRPARDFHVLGFSLQHELQYTNVLNMMDLAGLALRCSDRGDGDPIVLAGGPCVYNPEPMSEFIDAFVMGDGETVSGEIAACLLSAPADKQTRRASLELLAEIEGVYVPAVHGAGSERPVVARRVEACLREEDFPIPPIVPVLPITHDRLTLEVMRGCTRGCRFCSAGMLGRPVRQRSVDSLVRLAEAGIEASGWDEVSLVSLSTSDYYDLESLVRRLAGSLESRHVGISLPSMRPGTFSEEIAGIVSQGKKAGLTFAPEAGSRRLRRSINKDVDEEDLYATVETAFRHGWDAVKLYFMVGLPGEDDSDIAGIVNMVRSVEAICRVYGRRRNITVSLSPFVPRPHTPFQWQAQVRPEEVLGRIRHIRKHLPGTRIKLKWRDPNMAALEGMLCRGERAMARAVYLAWERGARFDGWTDTFDFDLWMRCIAEAGVDRDRTFRPMAREEPLPWEFIGNTVSRDFLVGEAERADRQELTPDCRIGPCSACGACPGKEPASEAAPAEKAAGLAARARGTGPDSREVRMRYRVKFAKTDGMRLTSHLDVVRCIQRALRRADLPVSYSSGYSPHPRISFGPPLPLGLVGEGEYFDVLLYRDPGGPWLDRVNGFLPDGLRLLKTRLVALQGSSLMKFLNAADYSIEINSDGEGSIDGLLPDLEKEFRGSGSVLSVDLAEDGTGIKLNVSMKLSQGAARPDKLVEKALAGANAHLKIVRKALYREDQGMSESPFGTPVNEEQDL